MKDLFRGCALSNYKKSNSSINKKVNEFDGKESRFTCKNSFNLWNQILINILHKIHKNYSPLPWKHVIIITNGN
jgi:hypothetical protein